jgi:hypothetical protein
MAKYHVETTNGTYEVETDEAPPLGEQPASLGGVAKTMASQAGTALSTAASDIAGAPAAMYGAIRHPIDTLKAGISTPKPPQVPESQLPQDAFHRFQRIMGGGPNNLAPADTPTSEVIGHGLALGAMSAVPSAIKAVPQTADAVMSRVPQGFGINPDIRAGAAKAAAGYAATELAPGPLKWPIRAVTMYPGVRQLARGVLKPDAAAGEAVNEIPTAKPTPNPQAEMLDKVAQGFGYKGFDGAPEAAKATIQDVVTRMGKTSAPPPRPTPAPAPQPLPPNMRISAPARVFTPPAPADTSGPIKGYSPTILEREPAPQSIRPPLRQLGAGPRVIQMPAAPDTSGPIPFTPPEAWSAPPRGTITTPKPSVSITMPTEAAEEVVGKVEHPPFAKDQPYSPSKKAREQAPQPTSEEKPMTLSEKLKANPDAAKVAKKLKRSLGGK